jgi:DivIVA domain-containing protein
MYNDKIILTPQDILDKEFKIDARGYRPQEVDKFLDLIIKDYTEFMATNKKLAVSNDELERENNKLRAEIRRLKDLDDATDSSDSSSSRVNNIDLLKRISQLEKTVYGKNI